MQLHDIMSDPRHPSYPLIRPIVEELRRDYARWRDRVRAFELATVNSTAGEPTPEADALEAEVRALAVDIQSYVAEINYLGVEFDIARLMREEP